MNYVKLKNPLLIAVVGLGLGLLADLLTYNQPLGISVPIIAALVVLALIGLALVEGTAMTAGNLWLAIPLLALAGFSAVRAAPFPRFLNVSGAVLLLALLANRLGAPPLVTLDIGGYVAALLESMAFSLFGPFRLLPLTAAELRQREGTGGRPIRRVAVGLLVALPFLCIFTMLFAAADLVFSNAVNRILEQFSVPDIVGHSLLTVTLAWIIMGGLAYALARTAQGPLHFTEATTSTPPAEAGDGPAPETPAPQAPWPRRWLGALEGAVALFSIDALFVVFVAIQFAALFGGEAFLRSQGLTYSEYARRGFFELLAVAAIILCLILGLDFVTRRETPRQRTGFLAGAGLMIALTIVILGSAVYRLWLYEVAYGFTRLRVHSHVFMGWLAILLAVVFALLLTSRIRWFATAALIAAIGFTLTLDVLNPDAFIVRENIARYVAGEELDVAYLGSLSEDAAPLLIPLLTRYGPAVRDQAGPLLRAHLDQLDRRAERAGWPSAHLSTNLAHRALNASRSQIEQFEPAYMYWWD
jgi:hypothetical protein